MVLGQESVQVSELFVVHGHRAFVAIPGIYRKPLILPQLSTRLVTVGSQSGRPPPRGTRLSGLAGLSLTTC
jgi:hypothetical protein